MTDKPRVWLKTVVDYGPIVVFFAAYLLGGLFPATAALMVVTAFALALAFLVERRVAVMPLVTAVIIGVFGGLTLWLQDETFIKMKPTIIQGLFAVILFGGLAFGRPLLKLVLGHALPLDDTGWRRLTLRWGYFFAAMAVINEIVWRTQTTDVWVAYKVFGILVLTVAAPLQKPANMGDEALRIDREVPVEGRQGRAPETRERDGACRRLSQGGRVRHSHQHSPPRYRPYTLRIALVARLLCQVVAYHQRRLCQGKAQSENQDAEDLISDPNVGGLSPPDDLVDHRHRGKEVAPAQGKAPPAGVIQG